MTRLVAYAAAAAVGWRLGQTVGDAIVLRLRTRQLVRTTTAFVAYMAGEPPLTRGGE